jgi:hypothetical protein
MAHVFVFGSNLAGRHGKGAALYARQNYGAVYGVGEGRTGNSYALPTKDANLKRLSLLQIHANIGKFAAYARANPSDVFIMTAIGTGLAGYSEQEIGELFFVNNLPENVFISAKLFNIL